MIAVYPVDLILLLCMETASSVASSGRPMTIDEKIHAASSGMTVHECGVLLTELTGMHHIAGILHLESYCFQACQNQQAS